MGSCGIKYQKTRIYVLETIIDSFCSILAPLVVVPKKELQSLRIGYSRPIDQALKEGYLPREDRELSIQAGAKNGDVGEPTSVVRQFS
jgi:hypothetical protein